MVRLAEILHGKQRSWQSSRSKGHTCSLLGPHDHLMELLQGAPTRQTDSAVFGITATKFAAPTVHRIMLVHSCIEQSKLKGSAAMVCLGYL
jgi:hypothetical protein